MTPETLNALKASIQKWARNAEAENTADAKIGLRECPLCEMFNYENSDGNFCRACPVFDKTGEDSCYGTPFPDAAASFWAWRDFGAHHKAAFRTAATAERDFLIGLLPEGEDWQ